MRLATRTDLPALTALWQTCFGDPCEEIRRFFDLLFGEILVFLSDSGTSMAISMPVFWNSRRAAYLYAVCTAPEARGQGQCRTLLREAEAFLRGQGISYALLVPASDPLFSFYGSLGYQTTFYQDTHVFSCKKSDISAVSVSADRYALLHRRYAPEGVQYPDCLLTLQGSYGMLLELPGLGCAAAERTENGWLVRELLSSSLQQAADAIAALLHCQSLPAAFPGHTPHGMAKSLDGAPLFPSYLGLSFA